MDPLFAFSAPLSWEMGKQMWICMTVTILSFAGLPLSLKVESSVFGSQRFWSRFCQSVLLTLAWSLPSWSSGALEVLMSRGSSCPKVRIWVFGLRQPPRAVHPVLNSESPGWHGKVSINQLARVLGARGVLNFLAKGQLTRTSLLRR